MDFCRTKDLAHVYQILTCPSIYWQMGDDFLPPAEEFTVNAHPDIQYLVAGKYGLVGMFCLFPQNRVCWELHSALLPWATKWEKREAGRDLVPWLFDNTECRRLTASIPSPNREAIMYATHVIGMKYVGRQHKAFMRDGKLQDLVIFGRSVDCGRLVVSPACPGHYSRKRSGNAEKRFAEITKSGVSL